MPLVKREAISEAERRLQLVTQQETELIGLRREYHVLDADRTQRQSAGIPKLNKDREVITIFQNEYADLLKDLKIATSHGNVRKDSIQYDRLNDLVGELDLHDDKVKETKMYIKEVEDQIKIVSRHVQELRKNQIGEAELEALLHNAHSTLETLENKLEVRQTQFNMIVAKNALLRDRIDLLLVERHTFMTLFDKLIDKLSMGKQIMLDLIEQATLAYDQRDEWCNKLQLLRIKAHRDLTHNTDQMRRCNQKIAYGHDLQNYYTIKGQKRVMKDLMRKETLKRLRLKENLEEKLKTYKDMVSEIKTFTKELKIERLTSKYYLQESRNFSQFVFIIERIRQMEFINDQLGFLHLDIEEHRTIHSLREEGQKQKLEEINVELEEITKSAQEAEETLNTVYSHLQKMMTGVSQLFHLCKCSRDPLLKLLNNNSVIKDYNVLLYLQVLENTIQNYLVVASYREKTLEVKRSKRLFDTLVPDKIYDIEKIVKTHPCALCLEHEVVSDVTDVAHRPWNREQTKERLKSRKGIPGANAYLHTVSKCHLPQSRRMMQRRYE